jgi:hypothetical protein
VPQARENSEKAIALAPELGEALPDPGIGTLKVDSLVDPLRKEPRFQEIERKLKFPI